jgi:hypothetical protein
VNNCECSGYSSFRIALSTFLSYREMYLIMPPGLVQVILKYDPPFKLNNIKMTVTIVTLPSKQVFQVQCHRCGHVWLYTGRNRHFAQCSHCRTTVTLFLKKEFGRGSLEKYHPQTGLSRATNSEDQNAATDTTTLERDYTEHE